MPASSIWPMVMTSYGPLCTVCFGMGSAKKVKQRYEGQQTRLRGHQENRSLFFQQPKFQREITIIWDCLYNYPLTDPGREDMTAVESKQNGY